MILVAICLFFFANAFTQQQTITKFNVGSTPRGIVLDQSEGNLFIAAKGAESISKLSLPDGIVNKSYIVGLNDPVGVAFDNAGNLYVSDIETKVIRSYDSLGNLLNDNFGSPLDFTPDALEFDDAGSLYVYSYSHGQVRKITASGVLEKTPFIRTLAIRHGGLFFDARDGYLYVTDSSENSIKKRRINDSQIITVATGFNVPCDVVVDCLGDLFVSNSGNHTISKITVRGVVENIEISDLDGPCGLDIDVNGNLYVSNVNAASVIMIGAIAHGCPPTIRSKISNVSTNASTSASTNLLTNALTNVLKSSINNMDKMNSSSALLISTIMQHSSSNTDKFLSMSRQRGGVGDGIIAGVVILILIVVIITIIVGYLLHIRSNERTNDIVKNDNANNDRVAVYDKVVLGDAQYGETSFDAKKIDNPV